MTNEERIERICDTRVPIYRKDNPALGIVKDCPTNRGIKELARAAIRTRLRAYPEQIEIDEKQFNICN